MSKCPICGAEAGSCPAEFIGFARSDWFGAPSPFGTSGVMLGTECSDYPLIVFRRSMVDRILAHWPMANIQQVAQGMYCCPFEWKRD